MPEKPGMGLPPSGFGPALRSARTAKGLTQRELGEAAGLHPNTVAKMERGEVEPSWQAVLAIAKALGVDCTAFTGGEQPARPATQSGAVGSAPAPKRPSPRKGRGKK